MHGGRGDGVGNAELDQEADTLHFHGELGVIDGDVQAVAGRMEVEGCKYMFESKTIQRMELLVLSALQWNMNPVTPISHVDHINRITSALRISEEKMDDYYELITEIINGHGHNLCCKRKHEPTPSSPSGVIDAYFSSDSSNDSWAIGSSSSSSSPEPLSKRFAPLSTVFWRG
ncbi:cyclin-d3-2 [Phtheirospermum japonicum]|uniref:Cyclin-d3-2 n=1 Tax=Phtheirospermum japonicum TaxID=374723 RepID=A0A830D4J4_9LAMI|nr:cyclin-d3-2 [Phtheirospermum japonicum]